jgi:hypothetical protein
LVIDHVSDELDLSGSALHVDKVEPAVGKFDTALLNAGNVLGVKPTRPVTDPDHEPCHAGMYCFGPHHHVGKATDQRAVVGSDRPTDQAGHRHQGAIEGWTCQLLPLQPGAKCGRH